MSEVDKLDVCATLGLHVEYAQKERKFYNDVIQQARDTPDQLTHPTFDFSENFALPYHARQPGPVDIKVLFRVNNFGIANQPAKSQTHHLFHEGQTIAMDKNNGPNCVVSMLDHYSSIGGRRTGGARAQPGHVPIFRHSSRFVLICMHVLPLQLHD